MVWFMAHWRDLLMAVLGIDAALIPLFPEVPFLVKIKNFLGSLFPSKSP